MSEELHPIELFCLCCKAGNFITCQVICTDSCAWFYEMRYEQTDDKGQGCYHFKVQQSFPSYPPNFFHIASAGNTQNDGKENDRCNDHLDQVDKFLTDQFSGRRKRWKEPPYKDT